MVVGFNHNFRYRGEVFHVQTEDGGLRSPNIITLLYRGGTILASRKTSYADIARVDNLEKVVEDLMKEQHKEMLRRLKSGDFDEIIAGRRPAPSPPAEAPAATEAARPASPAPPPKPPPAPPPRPATPAEAAEPREPHPPAPAPAPDEAVPMSLDDVILSYLVGDDES